MSGDKYEDISQQFISGATSDSSTPYWYDTPGAWDSAYIGNLIVPGIVDVDVKAGYKLDKKKPPGINGGTITFKGQDFTTVKIIATIWTAQHLKDANKLLAKILPVPDKATPSVYSISHALTNTYNVHNVYVETIEGPHPSRRVHGAKDITIVCLEYRHGEKEATVTPTPVLKNRANALIGAQAPSPVKAQKPSAGKVKP